MFPCSRLLWTPLLVLCATSRAFPAADLYYPPAEGEWQTLSPAEVGWDAKALDAALDYAGQQKSSGVVVLWNGKILAERYWEPPGPGAALRQRRLGKDRNGQAIEDVASVQKSVASLLVGIARHQGLLRLEDPVHRHLGKGWSQAAPEREAAITLRHLITMTSGLSDDLRFQHPAGTRWRYNSTAYGKTLDVLEKASGKDLNTLTREWLTGPIGMQDSRWTKRPALGEAAAANPWGFATSARDLARLGLLLLAQGEWDGQSVLADKAYLQEATSPSQDLNPSYGYLWWLNGKDRVVRGNRTLPGPLIPTAPPDLIAALGAQGRKCYVVPSQQLVVTRLGAGPAAAFDREFWNRLKPALPRP